MGADSRKILHICQLDKFIPPYIEFLQTHFDDFAERHRFVITGDKTRFPHRSGTNIVELECGKRARLRFAKKLAVECMRAEKIILHGLFNNNVCKLLALIPWVLPKVHWAIWGGDLYCSQSLSARARWSVNENFRRFVIKRFGHFVTHVHGDYKLACQWYGARGQWHECFMYTSNVFCGIEREAKEHSCINILLGNSADPSNNHVDALERLLPFRREDIHIYAPLSYGSREHAETVASHGYKLFPGRFTAINTFMGSEEYHRFLNGIDIAIFNHGRQQAMGNIINLLGMGKTVYMRPEITSYDMLVKLGLDVKSIYDISVSIERPGNSQNKAIVRSHFSEAKLRSDWCRIFG